MTGPEHPAEARGLKLNYMARTLRERRAHYEAIERRRTRGMAKVSETYRKALDAQVRAASRALRDNEDVGPAIERTSGRVLEAHVEAYTFTYRRFAEYAYRDIDGRTKGGPSEEVISLWVEEAEAYATSAGAAKVTLINRTTRLFIQGVIAEGLQEGLSIPQIIKRLRDRWADLRKSRAERIARTEVVAASNHGSRAGAKATGLELTKSWLSTPDNRTRADHEEADGQTTALDEPYTVGGEQLMYPGDVSMGASAANVVNCRCTEVYETFEAP